MMRSLSVLACFGYAGAASYTFDVRDWVVDYQRPTINPRKVPMEVPVEYKKAAIFANDAYPGPTLEAFEGETLEVTVVNNLLGAEIALHFDCVAKNSCDMLEVNHNRIRPQGFNTTYRLKAMSEGTYLWAADLPMHAARGLKGAVVIRKRDDPLAAKYQDQMMFLSEEWKMPEVCLDAKGDVVNGCPEIEKLSLNGQWGDDSKGYDEPVWEVKKNQCYKLRVLGAMAQPQQFIVSIKDHPVQIYGSGKASDSVTSFEVKQGEGVHALLCATQGSLLGGDYAINMTYVGKKQSYTLMGKMRYPIISVGEDRRLTLV